MRPDPAQIPGPARLPRPVMWALLGAAAGCAAPAGAVLALAGFAARHQVPVPGGWAAVAWAHGASPLVAAADLVPVAFGAAAAYAARRHGRLRAAAAAQEAALRDALQQAESGRLARRSLEAELQRPAHYDPLTALPNRTLFLDRLAHAAARGARTGRPPAVLVVALDGVSDGIGGVRDSLAPAGGSRVLPGVAARLLAATRGSDTVARVDRREFAVLVDAVAHPADAEVVARRVATALARSFPAPAPVAPGGAPLGAPAVAHVVARVGLAFAAPAEDAEAWLARATHAAARAVRDARAGYVISDDPAGPPPPR